jgi:RNA polymerase sigma-70 factor (ECF subfamily)
MSTAAIIHETTVTGERVFPLILTILAREEGDVLVRLQRREPGALAELYDRYGGMVYRLALRMVRDTGIAEDLVQETFLRAWNRCGSFDSERGAAGPWLLAIARNRALDYLRAQSRRGAKDVELNETEHAALFVDFPGEALNFDLARQVKRALSSLPAQQREALELAYFEGMSQSEIAERMRQPLGTIKTWMRRAILQLREGIDAGGAAR